MNLGNAPVEKTNLRLLGSNDRQGDFDDWLPAKGSRRKNFFNHFLILVQATILIPSIVCRLKNNKPLFYPIMSKSFSSALRAALAIVTSATLLIACDKQSVSPTDTASSARLSTDSTSTLSGDSTCHRGAHRDSTGHRHPADSSWGRLPMDSIRHDSTHHHRAHG
jgi:hypothetical protein